MLDLIFLVESMKMKFIFLMFGKIAENKTAQIA